MAAIVTTLVFAGRNRLRYLLSAPGAGPDTVTLTTTGAATPDLVTDLGANGGALLAIAKAFTQGYGSFAAGALTQAQARALWLSDTSGANPGVTPLAEALITARTGAATALVLDASVDGGGHPTLTATITGGAATAYLDIYAPNVQGV